MLANCARSKSQETGGHVTRFYNSGECAKAETITNIQSQHAALCQVLGTCEWYPA